MITLAIFEKMAADNVGGLVKNENFFWEEMPLQSNGKPASGVWIATRGGESETANGANLRTTIDFYVSFPNKIKTEMVHAAVREWIANHLCFCDLSGTVVSGDDSYPYAFSNVRLFQTETPRVAGVSQNGNIVKMTSVLVVYDLPSNQGEIQ